MNTSEQSSTRGNKFFSFVYNCYDTLKTAVRNYNAYASNYDPHQTDQYAFESNYNPFPMSFVTQDMEELIQEDVAPMKRLTTASRNIWNNITSSIIYGAFTFINAARNEKRITEAYFAEKPVKKEMRGCGVDFSPFIERSPELQFKMAAARASVRDSFLLKDKTTDYTWGFVNDDLSVKFESTLLPLKPPKGLFKRGL